MGIEIERRFLVVRELWQPDRPGVRYRQSYIDAMPAARIRVRIAGEAASLCVKTERRGMRRLEFEYAIPVADAEEMMHRICDPAQIDKTRYTIRFGRTVWEVDDYHGNNHGLLVAEVELTAESDAIDRPPWLGREITHEPKYWNGNLLRRPYGEWPETEKPRVLPVGDLPATP